MPLPRNPLLTALLLSMAAAANAQETVMDTVVVTASLQAQHEKETGRNVVVLRGEDLRRLPVSTLDEALRYVAGIEVQQRGPQGSQADIIIRGGTFQQVLVLIDGVRLNDPLTGHFNAYIPLPLQEIERIEVLKGAAASIHGSDAIGGVIHILTRTGTRAAQVGANRFATGVEAGELGLLNAHAWYRHRTEKSSLSLGAVSNNAKGGQLRGTTGFFHNHAFTLGLSRQLRDGWSLAFRSSADLRDFNAQNYYTAFKSDTARERVNALWQQVMVTRQQQGGRLQIDAAFKALEDIYRFRPAAAANENRTRTLILQSYREWKVDRHTTLTAGGQLIRRGIRSNDRGNHDLSHLAAYLIAGHRIGRQLHVNESLRVDWDGNYGTVLVPQANLSWSPSRLTLRGSIGKGIRDADFTERYNNYNKALVTSGSIGNPALRTERSWSYEAGMDYRIGADFKLSATVFSRTQRDLIDWTPTPYDRMPNRGNLVPGGTYALASNLSEVVTTGFEADLNLRRKLGERGDLHWMSGLTLLDSRTQDGAPSFYISSHARLLWNNSLSVRVGRGELSLTTLYKRRKTMEAAAINARISPEYLLVNAKLRLLTGGRGSGFHVQAYNLGNASFSDLLGALMPGRWLSAGFQWAL